MHKIFENIDQFMLLNESENKLNISADEEWEETSIKYLEEIEQLFNNYIKQVNVENWPQIEMNKIMYIIGINRDLLYKLDQNTIIENDNFQKILKTLTKSTLKGKSIQNKLTAISLIERIYSTTFAEKLLVEFLKQRNEIVSRMALIELGDIHSNLTEKYCIQAWEGKLADSNQEEQKLAALSTLYQIGSKLIYKYIKLAKEDGRESLSNEAMLIEDRLNPFKKEITLLIKGFILIAFGIIYYYLNYR